VIPASHPHRPRRRARAVTSSALALVAVTLLLFAAPAGAASPGSRPQIIGGTGVANGAYPFQAALIDLTRSGNDWDRQICGGTLIAPTWVLTAAHCVFESGVSTTPDQLQIVLGRTNLLRSDGERHAVKAIFHSWRYRETTDEDDVALVQLATPSAYAPIALAAPGQDQYEVPGTMLTVIGWGDTTPQPPLVDPTNLVYPQKMRVVQVPVVGDRACKADYAAVGDVIVTGVTVCAGAAGLDACYGDSGGPMFATTPGGPVEVGIVASGEGCGAPGFPGTYTEVNAKSVSNFITRTMQAHP